MLMEYHFNGWCLLTEIPQYLWNQITAPEGTDAEINPSLQRSAQIPQLILYLMILQKHVLCVFDVKRPGGSRPDTAGGSREQLCIQFSFTPGQKLTKTGLRQKQSLCSLADTAFLSNGNDIFQFL